MMISENEIHRLRNLSDEDLKAELGHSIFKMEGGLQARPPSLAKLLNYASSWLSLENEKLRTLICKNQKIKEIVESEQDAREKLIRVIADVISATTVYVPVGTVAEILIRDGIRDFCKTTWIQNC